MPVVDEGEQPSWVHFALEHSVDISPGNWLVDWTMVRGREVGRWAACVQTGRQQAGLQAGSMKAGMHECMKHKAATADADLACATDATIRV
jgi:hypothetical protein